MISAPCANVLRRNEERLTLRLLKLESLLSRRVRRADAAVAYLDLRSRAAPRADVHVHEQGVVYGSVPAFAPHVASSAKTSGTPESKLALFGDATSPKDASLICATVPVPHA